ncbi:MAG: OadG family protein [Lachnospiraceae bacterium]|nr:OadG family protein [Lachnospiraceae bacterium]
MKQKMKRVWLVLCMVTLLFGLTACSKAADTEEETVDAQTASYICQVSESLLQQITSFSAEDAAAAEERLLKDKQTVLASGLTSWQNVMGDTGAFGSIIASEAALDEEGNYYCTVNAQFENREVEFKIFYSMDDQSMEPTSISFAPEYTTGEKMTKAAMNTLMGMGTVFVVLIFISILISCFKFISVFENRMKAKEAPAPAPAPAAPALEAAEEEELVDDLELVAVITAAIAAATNSSTDGLVVRSIKRAPGAKWKRA